MKRIVENLLHKELSYLIQGAAIEVRKDFGSGHKEKLYQTAFANELTRRHINFEKEKAIKIFSPKDSRSVGSYRPDFVVNDQIIVELKAEKFVSRDEMKRVYDYLRNSKYELAYLINFASPKLFIKRIIHTNDRKPRLPIILVFISILLVSFSVVPPARAMPIGLATTHERFDLDLIPGTTMTETTTVFPTNATAPLPLHISVVPWTTNNTTGALELRADAETINAAKWITVTPTDAILPPNGSQVVSFTVRAPDDAAAGTYLAMLRLRPVLPPQYFEQEGPHFIPEVGILLFLNIRPLALDAPSAPYDARIISLLPKDAHRVPLLDALVQPASAGAFDAFIKTLLASIENTGVYYFAASGTVTVQNILGRTILTVPLPRRYLLPHRTRSLPVDLIPPPPDNSRILNSLFHILQENSYLGPYTAILTLEIPNHAPVIQRAAFWIIPWKFLLTIAMGAGFLFLVIKKLRHRLRPAIRALTHQ